MSDTPRTDAEATFLDPYEREFVPAEVARQLERELNAARPEGVALVAAAALEEACIIALAISGHFSANPDEWLRGHEKRLRELEKHARLRMNSGSK